MQKNNFQQGGYIVRISFGVSMRSILNTCKLLFYFLLIISFVTLPKLSFARENYDYFSRNLKIPNSPTRIVSLSPAVTEMLYALGLEKKIVGVTTDCNYPAIANKKDKIGKFGFVNLEKLVSLKPDLLVANSDMGKQLESLGKLNIPLIALETPGIDGVIKNINFLGKLTDSEKKAKELSKNLQKRLLTVKKKINSRKAVKIFYCVWPEPLITAGGKSFIGDLLRQAGGINIAESLSSPFSRYSIESLIAANPDYLIFPETTFATVNLEQTPWNRLDAVKKRKILKVNEDLYQRPAPRIMDALEELQKAISR